MPAARTVGKWTPAFAGEEFRCFCACRPTWVLIPSARHEAYAIPISTLLAGCTCRLSLAERGGSGSGNAIPRIFRPRPVARGQPALVRQHRAAECGRAEQGRKLGILEQSADQEYRHLYDTACLQLGWHGVPLGPASDRRRRPHSGSQLSPHLVPHTVRGMEDQELTRGAGSPNNCLNRWSCCTASPQAEAKPDPAGPGKDEVDAEK
jgi:hypothetical protein